MENTRQHHQLDLGLFGCFGCTKPLACYDIKNTEGKEGHGAVSQKVGSCVAIPLSLAPLWRGFLHLPHLHLVPSAPLHLHLPACIPSSAPSITPPSAGQEESRWRGHPSQWCSPFIPRFWGALPHEKCRILLSPPWKSSPAPQNYCSKALPLLLPTSKEMEGEGKFPAGNFLLEESCEGTKRVTNYFSGPTLWAGCATQSKAARSSYPKSISDFLHSSLGRSWSLFEMSF